ncbi:MAG: hypothetical protein ACREIU_11685 [Planctomycetota bacterium]
MRRSIRTGGFACLAAIPCNGSLSWRAPSPQAPAAPAIQARVLDGHRSGVTAVLFSTHGAWLASSSLDGTARLWSTRSWTAARILDHGSEVYALAFSGGGRLLASGSLDRSVRVWPLR